MGNILASASISVLSGDTVDGRLLASTGAVTLIDDAITASTCTAVASPLASLPGIGAAGGIAGLAWAGWFLVRRRKTIGAYGGAGNLTKRAPHVTVGQDTAPGRRPQYYSPASECAARSSASTSVSR